MGRMMPIFSFKDRRKAGWDTSGCVREIVKCRAMLHDNRTRSHFLKELVNRYSDAQRSLAILNQRLSERQQRLDEDLMAAADIQKSLLPQNPLKMDGLEIAWRFIPSEMIGGDVFNVFRLDAQHAGIYMLDVSGHGVQAAMVTVSVSQMLVPHSGLVVRRQRDGIDAVTPPREVMALLDREYPLERFDMYFSMIYIVLDVRDGGFSVCNAGHMPALLFRRDGRVVKLGNGGTVIGLGGVVPFVQQEEKLYKGDRLILYTDGVTDFMNSRQELFGMDRFLQTAASYRDRPMDEMIGGIYDAIFAFGDGFPIQDDVSLLGISWNP